MTKLITFIATETDGFHLDKPYDKTIKKNLYKYAHIVKLIYHQGTYSKGKIKTTLKKSVLIKPEHFIFPDELSKINNITHDKLLKKGEDLESVMEEFVDDLKNSEIVIGHNLPFHIKTIQASLFRCGISHTMNQYTFIDIMDYNHNIEKPNLKNLAKNFLSEEYHDKSRNYNIILIKKIFAKLYFNMEKEVKNNDSKEENL